MLLVRPATSQSEVSSAPEPSFWDSLPNIEWFLGAAWAAGIVVSGFLWRLSVKVALLEQSSSERENSTERRHQENLHAWSDLRDQISRLTDRIDRMMDK